MYLFGFYVGAFFEDFCKSYASLNQSKSVGAIAPKTEALPAKRTVIEMISLLSLPTAMK